MNNNEVLLFTPYPFEPGQKIHIDGGKRKGDWEVVGLADGKVTLRCPVSGKEFSWPQFCYQVGRKKMEQWPGKNRE